MYAICIHKNTLKKTQNKSQKTGDRQNDSRFACLKYGLIDAPNLERIFLTP